MYPDTLDSAHNNPSVSTKFEINYPKGDIFASNTSIAHCTATDFNMGRGFALEVRKRFDHQPQLRSMNVKKGRTANIPIGKNFIFYLCSKWRSGHLPQLSDLRRCLRHLKTQCKILGVQRLAMPRIGSHNDGLLWSDVSEEISQVFRDSGIEIDVYDIPDEMAYQGANQRDLNSQPKREPRPHRPVSYKPPNSNDIERALQESSNGRKKRRRFRPTCNSPARDLLESYDCPSPPLVFDDVAAAPLHHEGAQLPLVEKDHQSKTKEVSPPLIAIFDPSDPTPNDDTPLSPKDGVPVASPDAAPASPKDGTPLSPKDGVLATFPDATLASPKDGTPLSPKDGVPAASPEAAPASPKDDTPLSPNDGVPAASPDAAPAPPKDGADDPARHPVHGDCLASVPLRRQTRSVTASRIRPGVEDGDDIFLTPRALFQTDARDSVGSVGQEKNRRKNSLDFQKLTIKLPNQ